MKAELERFGREKGYGPDTTRMRFEEIQDIVGFPWYYEMEDKYRG